MSQRSGASRAAADEGAPDSRHTQRESARRVSARLGKEVRLTTHVVPAILA